MNLVVVREIDQVNVSVDGSGQHRTFRGGEGDEVGVGRPVETAHAERRVFGDLRSFDGQEVFLGGGNVDGPELALAVVFFENLVVAEFFLAVLFGFALDGRRSERDLL